MFEQHPVPQQISSYQFKLVGDMNIKQFFQIAAGAIIALIVYGMPLPGFVKWPLIIVAAISGAAFAFLPIQDRPMEQWLSAFFRSIYSPTIFSWQQQNPPPQYFKQVAAAQPVAGTQNTDADTTHADVAEELTEDVAPAFIAGSTQTPDSGSDSGMTAQTGMTAPQADGQAPGVDSVLQQQVNDSLQGKVVSDSKLEENTALENAKATLKQRHEVVVPKQAAVATDRKGLTANENVVSSQTVIQTQENGSPVESKMTGISHQPLQQQAQTAQFSQDAAPPLPPTQPNIIKGQVMDSSGHIIDGAILEIKDSDGRPVRALKTNKAGHFQIVTPIPDGKYNLITEKDGFEFTPVELETNGEIVAPIAIRANT